MTKRIVTSALAAVLLSLSLVGCSDSPESRSVQCDVNDQTEHDSDCGYYNDDDEWVWYSFYVPGQTTTGVATEPAHDEEKSHKKKSKDVKKPKANKAKDSNVNKAPKANAPKVSVPRTTRKK